MNEELIFEEENGMPEDWMHECVFVRDGKGNLIELEIPDDKE